MRMKKLRELFLRFEPDKKEHPLLHTLYDGLFTFFFVPNTVTSQGAHIRDKVDLKRVMVTVVLALTLCYIFGIWNIGHQHFLAIGQYTGLFEGLHLKFAFGLAKILPIFIVTHLVGLGIEFYYAAKRGHSIEEGFLVTGALIPLIMPPDIPLWILAVGVAFALILGKEAFGGTGMNVWNIALLARVFIFFSYPAVISGDEVWVAGLEAAKPGAAAHYGWIETHLFNPLFQLLGLSTFPQSANVVDTFSGATPLSLAFSGGWDAVTARFSPAELWFGAIPGSVGEVSKPLILAGMAILLITGVASWRIIAGGLIGAAITAWLLNLWGATPMMQIPWYYHFYLGSALFAITFMATDPVTASTTPTGKWIYGLLIGFFGIIVRVINPAYPEGWMLAILFMNTFAPLIDHIVIETKIKRRLSRAKV